MLVTKYQLTLHDSLYYSTREMGRLYETEKYIHNWALTYALGLVQKDYFCPSSVPTYQEDLTPLNQTGVYVTPAKPIRYEYILNTFKLADNKYRAIMSNEMKRQLGIRITNKPSYGRAKEIAAESEFEFYVMGTPIKPIPKWIRLGLWMSKARINQVGVSFNLQPQYGRFTCAHPLNPLDLLLRPELYDLISMPPISLVCNATLQGKYVQVGEISLPVEMRYFGAS
ncbi:type I-D CRISPR-associated protein Cas5/Csc1 [Candidatus Poribacteria bacterium]|nr:type I-D CRISPR-associated protein Cas5/Csc1 [Candidatus Poribacteria bacterium]